MRLWVLILTSLLLSACAQAPVAPRPDGLFQDHRFAPPSERISAADIFAISDEMKHFLREEIGPQLRAHGLQRGLVEALYRQGQLKLDYDTASTRNAAEAFRARAGNCLSLVVMTASFARELNLSVEFQSAFLEEAWARNGNFYLRSGHVNITLGRRFIDAGKLADSTSLTIDFLPPEDIRGLRTQPITEQTVAAMFMNNRSAEALLEGRIADAYWWAREAMVQSPLFMSAYNTLGVIYLRQNDARQAERVFAQVLAREPANTRAMFNLVLALKRQDRPAEAAAWEQRLALLEPEPPFHFFDRGLAAMKRDDFAAARDWFSKEVARAAYHHESHFWLGVANYRLGEMRLAAKHLGLAMENSPTRGERDLYAAKLASLQARTRH
jgi:tetratricopeptide (TPR) repeat protein